MDKIILGKKLRQIRLERDMSQEQLSELIFISPRQMSVIETGNSYPSLDTFVRIAEVLEIDMNEFFNIKSKALDEERVQIIDKIKSTEKKHLPLINKIVDAVMLHG